MGYRDTFLLLVAAIFLSSTANAITDEEIYRNFQFSFLNPGARATGMGNAFIGLADDATAAEANPAGLTILNKPEVSVEYRRFTFEDVQLNSLNDVSIPQEALQIRSVNDLTSINVPSFFSFVYPVGEMTFAFSRQEAVRLEGTVDELFHFELEDGTILDAGALGEEDLKVVNWNFSAAREFTPRLSVGITLRYSQCDWRTRVENFLLFPGTDPLETFSTQMDDDDGAFAFSGGFIYNLNRNVYLGAVYKRNAKFEAAGTETGRLAKKPGAFDNILKIPDSYGFGVAVKPNDIITVSADLVRIEYSDLLEAFEVGRNFVTSIYDDSDIRYRVNDIYEFRIGAEFFVLLKDIPIALRQGYYRKPSNAIVADSVSGVLPFDRIVVNAIFADTDDENHFTLGSGLVFRNFQVDGAFDIGKSTSNFVLSTVVRF